MAVLSIEEHVVGTDSSNGFNALVRFENRPAYHVTINKPISDEEERELEWYFEEHLEFPFINKVRAQNAAASVTNYGEELFRQVFSDLDIYSEYRQTLNEGLHGLHIEIEGTPAFHSLHWETLKDPKFAQPLALQATIVRKSSFPSQVETFSVRPSPTINLLIVVARPSGERDVGYRAISRPLIEALRNANLPVQVDILRPGSFASLKNHLAETAKKYGEGYYHILHFDAHGKASENEAILFLEGKRENMSERVTAMDLANVLRQHQVPIVILNAC